MLIGSRAFQYWFPDDMDFPSTTDYDIITYDTIADINTPDKKIEIHNPDEYLSSEFLKYASDSFITIGDKQYPVCSLRGLAALKKSHLVIDHNWIRHISFYHTYLSKFYNEDDYELIKRREKVTLQLARQSSPKLSMSNDAFFDDFVVKKYDHDWLHERVAYNDAPLYTKLKYPEKVDSAWCEKDLWETLTLNEKNQCVSEECSVIALERFLIPQQDMYAGIAYAKALHKVCTTLCSGWFREHAVTHWDTIRMMCRHELLNSLTKELK